MLCIDCNMVVVVIVGEDVKFCWYEGFDHDVIEWVMVCNVKGGWICGGLMIS